ncbi:DUF4232 domain-containing protein [Kitasatospora sp. NPDC089797]|uniref:DUF4232 domain-containing protein n=1 Tax=Kitasatospora sp. NPDC089797 TaxID=3155298 RepID=UPI00342A8F8C
MRVHQVTGAALAVAAALYLAACGKVVATGARAEPAPAPAVTAVATPAATPAAEPASPASAPPPKTAATPASSPTVDKRGMCQNPDLTITAADHTVHGATKRTVVVELRNHSGHDCSISGFAAVDLDTTAGPLTADRTREPVVPVVLGDGRSAFFGITYPADASGSSGVRITGLRVTPPNDNRGVILRWPGAAALGGSGAAGSPIKVGPVGGTGRAD